jgi:hypothetical protein
MFMRYFLQFSIRGGTGSFLPVEECAHAFCAMKGTKMSKKVAWNKKLDQKAIDEIRRLRGKATQQALADRFGVSRQSATFR